VLHRGLSFWVMDHDYLNNYGSLDGMGKAEKAKMEVRNLPSARRESGTVRQMSWMTTYSGNKERPFAERKEGLSLPVHLTWR